MAISGNSLIALLLACGLLHETAATIYKVGGDRGWTFQPENSTFYDDQFKNITLFAGVDWLNFTFIEGIHNVIAVHEAYLANCNGNDPGGISISHSWTALTAGRPGSFGVICGVGDHCKKFGMHLNVTFVPRPPSPSALGISTSEVHADGSQPGVSSASVVRSQSDVLYWQ